MIENLIQYIKSRVVLTEKDIELLYRCFIVEEIPAQILVLKAGNIANYVYYINSGIVKGYENIDGKIVIKHLVADNDLFTSLESFTTQTPSLEYYETITTCELLKISKPDFDLLQTTTSFWGIFIKEVTNEHLSCKLARVQDFQILSAKERYLKFLKDYPKLELHVSVDNVASFLGMEPQSLSRIRKQIII